MVLSSNLNRRCASLSRGRGSRPGRRLRMLLLAIPCVWFAGCAMPPVQQFEGFASGFEQVRSTTYLLIDDFERASKTVKTESAELRQPPSTFDVSEARSNGVDSASDRRRRAIDAVVRYNEAMLALANGHSIEAAKAFVAPIAQLLNAAAPQFGFGGSLVEGLAGRALQARDNVEFVRAFRDATTLATGAGAGDACSTIAAGTDPACMPIIEGILEVLAQDTASYYEVQLGRYTKTQSQLADEYFEAARAVIQLAAESQGPAVGSAAAQSVREIAEELTQIRQLISPQSGRVSIAFAASGDAFRDSTLAAMQALMIPVRVVGESADANRLALIDYHGALSDYVALLDHTVMLLREVQDAAARPPDVMSRIERLAVIRTDLENDALSTQSALLRAIETLQ